MSKANPHPLDIFIRWKWRLKQETMTPLDDILQDLQERIVALEELSHER